MHTHTSRAAAANNFSPTAPSKSALHFGHKTFRHQYTSAPTLSRITGGAVSCRNCPWSKVSRLFVDLMPKCIVPRFWFLVQKCLVAEVSGKSVTLQLPFTYSDILFIFGPQCCFEVLTSIERHGCTKLRIEPPTGVGERNR